MQNKKIILTEIELVASFKVLAEAYEEISVMKMQRVRSSVLRTRDFLAQLSEVFDDVKVSYEKYILSLLKQKKDSKVIRFSTGNKTGTSISVFISANGKLYGDITQKVFRYFIESIRNKYSDIVIVGRTGRDLYDESGNKKVYRYFEIPDLDVKLEHLKELIDYILKYENVEVFYGSFVNIVSQKAMLSRITGEVSAQKETREPHELKFLFEPTLEKLFQFFQTQFTASLFKQTVHESHLSSLASRITAMEEALTNIDVRLVDLDREKNKIRRLTSNKKQNQTMSGISLWGKNL